MDEGIGLVQETLHREYQLIDIALELCEGNHTRAAEFLKIGRTTLLMKLKAKADHSPNEARLKNLRRQLEGAEQQYIKTDKIRTAAWDLMQFLLAEIKEEESRSLLHAKSNKEFITKKGYESLL